MYFEALPTYTQNLIMLNFEFFGKALLLLLAFSFSLFYIFYLKKNQEETPYLMMALVRFILYILSHLFLWIFPMMLFYMYPQMGLDKLLNFMLLAYIIGFFVVTTILLINILYIGPLILMKITGYTPMNKQADEIFNRLIGKKLSKFINEKMVKVYSNKLKNDLKEKMKYDK